jgi:hypothetical protein
MLTVKHRSTAVAGQIVETSELGAQDGDVPAHVRARVASVSRDLISHSGSDIRLNRGNGEALHMNFAGHLCRLFLVNSR